MTNFELEAELLTEDFKSMLVNWGSHSSDDRIPGMHASAILDKEFCAREQVLLQLFPEQGEKVSWNMWDWKKAAIFENGWDLHRRWQRVFLKYGNVVWTPATPEQITRSAVMHKVIHGKYVLPELDLTHYNEDLNIWFSPDAVLWFGGVKRVVEIKGINEYAFNGTPRDAEGNLLKGLRDKNGREIKPQAGLSDDLEQACAANETVHKAREQCNLYMYLLNLKQGVILIENKSNQDFKLWVIEYEQSRALHYLDRVSNVSDWIKILDIPGGDRNLPDRICTSITDTRAKACPMRAACFASRGTV